MELNRIKIFATISYIVPNYFDRMTHTPKDVLAPVVNAGVHSCSPVAPHSSVMLFLLNAGPLLERDRELGRETTSTFRKKEESKSNISGKSNELLMNMIKEPNFNSFCPIRAVENMNTDVCGFADRIELTCNSKLYSNFNLSMS